ncbi:placenta-specific 8 [Plakobranchus ocellatus]|uniref:Placenta-specific 8 n=1 Tax=Plakobranchus ocellatus TaxID=259542 RepID=A0AAV4A786_9GAST|nr:placenta-specific 8 [Plakobranchus ocellatus]
MRLDFATPRVQFVRTDRSTNFCNLFRQEIPISDPSASKDSRVLGAEVAAFTFGQEQNMQSNQKGYAPCPNAEYRNGQVVFSQPVRGRGTTDQQALIQSKRDWYTGVFDCRDDWGICLCATFCGLCFLCRLSSDMNESIWLSCCVPSPVLVLRTKWRTQNNIEGDICEDCLMTTCFGHCVACQLAREVKMDRQHNA